jgi:spermidine synthase
VRPRTLLAQALVPDTRKALRLYRSGDEYAIKIMGRGDLMTSRAFDSEKDLATLTCALVSTRDRPRLLVGGLGMGFTLRATLDASTERAEVVVAELVPDVVTWNEEILGHLAGHPLRDPRTVLHVGDVAALIRTSEDAFDAIMLDVDNGPEAMLRRENDWLYLPEGLRAIHRALRPGGVLSVWSAGPDHVFPARLRKAGYRVDEHVVRPNRNSKRARHHIWLARPAA